MRHLLSSQSAKSAFFVIWLILLLFSISKHTPWRDEYQSWLVSTQTENLTDFIDGIRHERHPPLHYLVQRMIYQIGFLRNLPTAWQIQISTLPFVIGSAVLLLFLLEFPWWLSLPLLFNPFFFREFAVISRCYSLGIFFLLLSLYFEKNEKKNWQNAALIFAAGTHLLFTLGVGIFYILEFFGSEKSTKYVWKFARDNAFPVTVLISILLFQIPPKDSAFVRTFHFDWNTLKTGYYYLLESLTGSEKFWRSFEWGNYAFSDDSAPVFLIALLYWIVSTQRSWSALIIPISLSLFLSLSYGASYRHLGVGFFFFLTMSLRKVRVREILNPVAVLSWLMLIFTLNWWLRWAPWQDRPAFDFSAGRELAHQLAPEGRMNKVFSKGPSTETSTPTVPTRPILVVDDEVPYYTYMAEAKTAIFAARRNAWTNYPYFTRDRDRMTLAQWCRQFRSEFGKIHSGHNILLGMLKGTHPPAECSPFSFVVESTQKVLTGEEYTIYKLN